MSVDELIRDREFSRWLNGYPGATTSFERQCRHAWNAAWAAANGSRHQCCFCRIPTQPLNATWKSCCWCGKASQ